MRHLLAALLLSILATTAAAAPCTDTYEGPYFGPFGEDKIIILCWPVLYTESTVWKDLNGTTITIEDLTEFEDQLIATGCIDADGFTLIADEIVLQGVIEQGGEAPCATSYEGHFMASGFDADLVFLTCWPVRVSESTIWRDEKHNAVDPQTLTFEDVCTATGCIDADGFTLLADEIVLHTATQQGAPASDEQIVLGVGLGPDWFLQAVSDPSIGATGSGNPNPEITLIEGLRYTFTNAAPVAHPFSIIALGATPAGDTVLLAQGGAAGTLEGDLDIMWEDNGNDVTFTLTPALAAAMAGTASQEPGYRCEVHTGDMRGTITTQAASSVDNWLTY